MNLLSLLCGFQNVIVFSHRLHNNVLYDSVYVILLNMKYESLNTLIQLSIYNFIETVANEGYTVTQTSTGLTVTICPKNVL